MKYTRYAEKKVKNEMSLGGLESLVNVDGANITANNAMKNSDVVFACINLIASTISRMSLHLYRDNAGAKERVNNELISLLSLRPNEHISYTDFMQSLLVQTLAFGNGYAWIETKKGQVKNLILLDSSVTRVEKYNKKLYVVTSVDNTQYKIPYDSVVHIKDVSLDGIHGLSRIDVIKNKLNNRADADNLIGNAYKKGGGAIKGVINVPSDLSSQAKIKLKEGFINVLNSDDSNIAVLDGGLEIKQLNRNVTLVDSQFIDSLKMTKEDTAMIYGVSPVLLGSTEQTSFNNLTMLHQQFVMSLIPLITKIEQEFTYKLLSSDMKIDYWFSINVSSALRENDEARANFYGKMLEKGVMTINECRRKEHLNDVEGGDIIRVDLNHVALDKVDDYQQNKSLQGVKIETKEE